MKKLIGVLFFVCSLSWGQTVFPGFLPQTTAAGGAIAFDNASAKNSAGNNVVGADTTVSYTTGSSSNRYMGVWIALIASEAKNITSITYAGSGLTKRLDTLSTGESFMRLQYWDLVAPSSGANNLVITPSKAMRIAWVVSTWSGVHQTTPRGTIVVWDATGTGPSVNASSASGEVVIDGVTGSGTISLTEGGGQTNRAEIETNDVIGHSSEPGAGTVTMSWTLGTSTPYLIIAVPIKPS